jgi:hypothetical protein
VEQVLGLVPGVGGRPLRVRFLPDLRAHRGRLRSGGAKGQEVHAGSFVPRREIVLESALAAHPAELTRVLLHELFHFVWLHAGNPLRRSYELLLQAEMRRGARGELGWSAESRKQSLAPADMRRRSRRWRDYVCESFCDTAAWRFAGLRTHEEFTLAPRFRSARREWLRRALAKEELSV